MVSSIYERNIEREKNKDYEHLERIVRTSDRFLRAVDQPMALARALRNSLSIALTPEEVTNFN